MVLHSSAGRHCSASGICQHAHQPRVTLTKGHLSVSVYGSHLPLVSLLPQGLLRQLQVLLLLLVLQLLPMGHPPALPHWLQLQGTDSREGVTTPNQPSNMQLLR